MPTLCAMERNIYNGSIICSDEYWRGDTNIWLALLLARRPRCRNFGHDCKLRAECASDCESLKMPARIGSLMD